MLPVKVYRCHKDAIIPHRSSEGALGYDLYACEEYMFYPNQFHLVRTGLIIKAEPHYGMIIVPRSSLFIKKGLIMPNSIGVIDYDYCGEEDEIKVPFLNLSDDLKYIKVGDKIAQILFINIGLPMLVEVDEVPSQNKRGGFGSTGGYK